MKTPHAIKIKNDFGTVRWTPEKEKAFVEFLNDAWTLQMTPGEFAEMLANSQRECHKCLSGQH